MRAWIIVLVIGQALLVFSSARMEAQESAQNGRKLVLKINPVYPDLARKRQLSGTVKMLVTVTPDGTVKKMELLGGRPLLTQTAQSAVQKWKWQAAADETRELVEIGFHP